MKSVLITGAGRGLGKGFVEYFLDQEFHVFAGVRGGVGLEDLASDRLTVLDLDVESDESIETAFATIKSQTDSLAYLINNAGINKNSATANRPELVSRLGSLKREPLLEMFNINSVAPLLLTQTFVPLLNQDLSFVINISSCRASFHDPFSSSWANYGYTASKVALNMYTFHSLFDLPTTIKTFAVHPGDVRTDMNPEGSDDPKEQARKIITITHNWHDELNGRFLNYDGSSFPL